LTIPEVPGTGPRAAGCGKRPIQANGYVNLLRGLGTIDWYTAMPLGEHAVPRMTIRMDGTAHLNGSYRGECYRERSGSPVRCRFEPNRITVAEHVDASDVLIINQNFDPGWRSTDGRVHRHHGLLAVGGGVRAGTVLAFTSRPLVIGAIASGLFLVTLAVLAMGYRGAVKRGAARNRVIRMTRSIIGP
jgi:hypothetical protein